MYPQHAPSLSEPMYLFAYMDLPRLEQLIRDEISYRTRKCNFVHIVNVPPEIDLACPRV